MKSVYDYRKAGYKVRVLHYRAMPFGSEEVSAKGGQTIIELTSPDGKFSATGIALCSEQDNYNKKVGVKIALGRAEKELDDLKGKGFLEGSFTGEF